MESHKIPWFQTANQIFNVVQWLGFGQKKHEHRLETSGRDSPEHRVLLHMSLGLTFAKGLHHLVGELHD